METETGYYDNEAMFYGGVPYIMGTRFEFVTTGLKRYLAEKLFRDVCSCLDRLDKMLNRFDAASEVSALNTGRAYTGLEISSSLWNVLVSCEDYYRKTRGMFDVTINGFSRVSLSGGRVSVSEDDVAFDFGGFAKGYALENIKGILLRGGVENAFVDFGGSSILAIGRHPYGDCWKVSLAEPFSRKPLYEFKLRDEALSVSGNSVGYIGHIINPLSGEKNCKRMVCAVVSGNPVEAEVLSTTVMASDGRLDEDIMQNFGDVEIKVFESENE